MIRTVFLAAIVVLGCRGPATAQTTSRSTATCPAARVAAGSPFTGWETPVSMQAAANVAGIPDAPLSVGQAAVMALEGTDQVRYAATPGRPGADGTYGGLALLRIEADGTYRVALGSAAWIDIARDGETISSTAHGHGPACSGVRKIVDFALTRGTYLVQIAGAPSASLEIMVAPSAR